MDKLTPKQRRQRDILELLRQGVSQAKALEQVGVSASTWYSWKKDSDFDAVAEQAIQEGRDKRTIAEDGLIEGTSGNPKHDLFINLYVSSGGIFEESCKTAGLTMGEVLALLNPLSATYSAPLHRLYEDAKLLLEVRAEDAIARNIRSGNTADAKWLLERRRPKEYGNKLKIEEPEKKPAITQAQANEVLHKILGGDEPPNIVN